MGWVDNLLVASAAIPLEDDWMAHRLGEGNFLSWAESASCRCSYDHVSPKQGEEKELAEWNQAERAVAGLSNTGVSYLDETSMEKMSWPVSSGLL
jgi:hypothetical protein